MSKWEKDKEISLIEVLKRYFQIFETNKITMELFVLIITSTTLLLNVLAFLFYWKNIKAEKEATDNRFKDINLQLDELKKSVSGNVRELSATYQNENKQVIENFNTAFTEFKNENKAFKIALTQSHNEALKDIMEELTKILKEIKAPLDLD